MKRKVINETMPTEISDELEIFDSKPEDLIAFLEGREPTVQLPQIEERIAEMVDVDNKITEKKQEIKGLLEKRRMLEAMNVYSVADILHSRHCQKNHTSDCKWHFESWEEFRQDTTKGVARQTYYEKANKLLRKVKEIGITIHQALQIDEIIDGR
jgi:hypothetical protein